MQLREVNNKYVSSSVRRGIIRNITRNNTLDSATIVLTHVKEIESMHVWDLVELTNEFNQKEYWAIADFTPNYVTLEEPFLFDYTINLVEPTAYLDHITLPSMSITNIGQNRTIRRYLQNILTYFKNNYSNAITWSIGNIANGVCPECKFSSPTMREYINYLLSFVDGAPYCKLEFTGEYWILKVKNPNEKGSAIPTKYINNMIQTQAANEYTSIINNESNDIINKNPIVEYQALKSNEAIFDSNSASIILSHKPYDIKKLIAFNIRGQLDVAMRTKIHSVAELKEELEDYTDSDFPEPDYAGEYQGVESTMDSLKRVKLGAYKPITSVRFNFADEGGDYTEDRNDFHFRFAVKPQSLDITKHLVVDSIFNTLEVLKNGSYDYKNISYTNNLFVNNTLKWSRGNNTIDNIYYYQKGVSFWRNFKKDDEPAINYIIQGLIWNDDEFYKKFNYSFDLEKGGKWYRVLVAFYSLDNPKIIQRCLDVGEPRPTGSLSIDTNWKTIRFKIEYIPYTNVRNKITRPKYEHYIESNDSSSNATTDLYNYYKKTKEVVKSLGNKSIVFTAKTPADKVYYQLGDTFGDNYIMNDLEYTIKNNSIMYKGILTKDYANQDINTAINREKRYYSLPDASESVLRNEFYSYDVKISLVDNISNSGSLALAGWLKKENNYCQFKTYDRKGLLFNGVVPCTTLVTEDSITYNVEMQDNVVSSIRVGDSINGGYAMIANKYVNDDGEIETFNFRFGRPYSDETQTLIDGVWSSIDEWGYVLEYATPITEWKGLKDSREVLGFSVQYNIQVNDSNIEVIGNISDLFTTQGLKYDNVFSYAGKHDISVRLGLWQIPNDDVYIYTINAGGPILRIKNSKDKYLNLNLIRRD